jgi:hypothetical protein
LTERVAVNLEVQHVLEIGINGSIDFENTERSWFEKVFNFYCSLKIGDPTDVDLVVTLYANVTGYMHNNQLALFFKDVNYEATYDKQSISLADFVDLVRSIESVRRAKIHMQKMMRMRHYQAVKCNGDR